MKDQEAEFRDWVTKANYESLVKAFNNTCGLKKQIISEEVDRRFKVIEQNYDADQKDRIKALDNLAEESQKLELYNLPELSPESLDRRINRKLP